MSEPANSTRAAVVIQARMSSTRLPGKVARPLGGASMLARLLERLGGLPADFARVVATSEDADDDAVADIATAAGWAVVRGPLDDVLGRYALALKAHPARYVVRVTGDNPFTDPAALMAMLDLADRTGADYVRAPDMPIGTAAEVFSAAALQTCDHEADTPYQREHINAFIWDHPDRFRVRDYPWQACAQAPRLTVDTPEDFAVAEQVLAALDGDMTAPMDAVLAAGKAVRHG